MKVVLLFFIFMSCVVSAFAQQRGTIVSTKQLLTPLAHPQFKFLKQVKDKVVGVNDGSGVIIGATVDGSPIVLTANHLLRQRMSDTHDGFIFSERTETRLQFKNKDENLRGSDVAFVQEHHRPHSPEKVGLIFYSPAILNRIPLFVFPYEDFGLLTVTGAIVEDAEAKNKTFVKDVMNVPYQGMRHTKLAIAEPTAGKLAVALGYSKVWPKEQAASIGVVISDEFAHRIYHDARYSEFDPDIEFLIAADGLPGITGGGVFNGKGELIGIVVNSAVVAGDGGIIRAVKATYIKKVLHELHPSPARNILMSAGIINDCESLFRADTLNVVKDALSRANR